MTINSEQRSATIIQFPARGRAIGGGHRDDMKSAERLSTPRYAKVAYGGAWYHEAAILEDAEPSRNS